MAFSPFSYGKHLSSLNRHLCAYQSEGKQRDHKEKQRAGELSPPLQEHANERRNKLVLQGQR